MQESDLPEDTRLARSQLRQAEESELTRRLVISATSFSPSAEQVTTWLLGAAGAGAVLYIPNLDQIFKAIGPVGARVCLGFLVASIVTGLLAKRAGLFVQYRISLGSLFFGAVHQVYNDFTARYHEIEPQLAHSERASFEPILQLLLKSAPWFVRWRIRLGAARGARDPLLLYRQALNGFGWQIMYTQAQWATFVAAILVAAFCA